MIPFAWSSVKPDEILDALDDCGVTGLHDWNAIDCMQDLYEKEVESRIDVDFDVLIEALLKCGFGFDEDSEDCLHDLVPDV